MINSGSHSNTLKLSFLSQLKTNANRKEKKKPKKSNSAPWRVV
ncbi:hypothetical protein CAEBREN_00707 [Caenorhabditis brenneri]|uniref:Uncharacterized protein n=1 Tax=Caenorhabditis brenneri TaxID=135651 RepID=G0N848_CAEBE|nr:hypothetical protein CAEBREN_00707 [Caenorhabditis brenneri]